jgi:hypothetical protein
VSASCELCGGRGWIIEPDGGNGTARPCSCRTSPPVADLLRRSRMQPAEIFAALEPWDTSVAIYPAAVEAWAIGKAQDPSRGPWAMVLLSAISENGDRVIGAGAPGRGKTKAAAMAMRRWCEMTGRSGLWINVPTDLDQVMDERRREEGAGKLESMIVRAPFLVLDDCGAERGNEPRLSAFSGWVHHRHRSQSPTLFTGNAADPEQLGDGRISSRLGEADVRRLVGAHDYRGMRAASRG